MSEAKPLFLAKSIYRSRRLADAARLLPVIAAFLVALPAVWSAQCDRAGTLSGTIVYLFAVWAGLILAAALIARGLSGAEHAGGGPSGDREAGQGPAPSPAERGPEI
jgi:hypothetical protein